MEQEQRISDKEVRREIGRLRAEIEALNKKIAINGFVPFWNARAFTWFHRCVEARRERDTLRAEIEQLEAFRAVSVALQKNITELEAEIERLHKKLETDCGISTLNNARKLMNKAFEQLIAERNSAERAEYEG